MGATIVSVACTALFIMETLVGRSRVWSGEGCCRLRFVRRASGWLVGLVLVGLVAGCQKDKIATSPPDLVVVASDVTGRYLLSLSEEEVEEFGGADKVPALVLSADGSWRLEADDETLSGTWSVAGGKVVTREKESDERMEYEVSRDMKTLTSLGAADEKVTFSRAEKS